MFVEPPSVVTTHLSLYFMDERHYEVFQAGLVMRERHHAVYCTSDRSYIIRLRLFSRIAGTLLPPVPIPGTS